MKVETKQGVQQNKGLSELLNKAWKPSKKTRLYDSVKSLKAAVMHDIKNGIERIYYVSVQLLMTSQSNNPLAERFTNQDTDGRVKSSTYLRDLAESWARCGNELANPPLVLFSKDYKELYVVHGNSRTRALSIIGGVKYMPVRVKLPTQMTIEQAERLAVDENRVRSKSSDYSVVMKIYHMVRQGYTPKEIAERRNTNVQFVRRCLAIARNPFILDAVRTSALGVGSGYNLANYAPASACKKMPWKVSLIKVLLMRIRQSGVNKIDIKNYYQGTKYDALKTVFAILAPLNKPITLTEVLMRMARVRNSGSKLLKIPVVRKASKNEIRAAIAELKTYSIG